jgi:hypothetical protein
MLDEEAFLTLNVLYLKKMAPAGDLPEVIGLPADRVRAMVSGFVEQGWVLEMNGDLLIQPEGLEQVEQYYRAAYSDLSQQDELARWYERFEALNSQFVKFVSDWQEGGGDPRVQERVVATVERLVKVIRQISQLVPRYAGYIRRFERSVTSVDEGNADFVCTPTVDSLHNIWFEFHEDFLAVLGRPRET